MRRKRDVEEITMIASGVIVLLAMIMSLVVIFVETSIFTDIANGFKNIILWGLGG